MRSKWPDRAVWAAGRWWKGMEGYLRAKAWMGVDWLEGEGLAAGRGKEGRKEDEGD
jgi:hypothetical protein